MGEAQEGDAPAPPTSLVARLRANHKLVTYVVGFSFFVDYLLLLAMIPILPLFGEQLGLTHTDIGLLFAIKPMCQMAANPIVGHVCDITGPRRPMLAALLCLMASTILFAFAPTFEILCIARILQGISSSGNIVAGMAYLGQYFSGPRASLRTQEISIAQNGIAIGVMCGAPFGGVLYSIGGSKELPFLVAAGFLFIDTLARAFLLPDVQQEAKSQTATGANADPAPSVWRTVVKILTDAQVMLITGVLFFGNAGISFIEAQFPLYLARTFGSTSLEVGFIYGAQTMLFMICMTILGPRNEKLGRTRVMFYGLIIMGAFLPLMPCIDHLAMVVPMWLAEAVGMAGIDSTCNPELANIVDARHPGAYGKVFAVANTGNSLGFVLGPIIGGAINDHTNFLTACICVGATLLAYSPLVFCGFPEIRSCKPGTPSPPASDTTADKVEAGQVELTESQHHATHITPASDKGQGTYGQDVGVLPPTVEQE